MRQREREAETQAEGEAGSMQEGSHPGSRPESKADAYLLSHPGIPVYQPFLKNNSYDGFFDVIPHLENRSVSGMATSFRKWSSNFHCNSSPHVLVSSNQMCVVHGVCGTWYVVCAVCGACGRVCDVCVMVGTWCV